VSVVRFTAYYMINVEQAISGKKGHGKYLSDHSKLITHNILTASKSVNANLNLPRAMLADARL